MLAALQRLHGQIEVRMHRRRDRDGVDLRVVQQIAKVGRDLDRGVAQPDLIQPLLPHIAHRNQLSLCYLKQIANQVGTPVSISDDSYVNHASSNTASICAPTAFLTVARAV